MSFFVHCPTYQKFISKKISANIQDTSYTIGVEGEIYQGTPDVSWNSICFITDTKQIWTHGTLYSCTTDLIIEEDSSIEIDGVIVGDDGGFLKYTEQTLTESQKAQARRNIDAPQVSEMLSKFDELNWEEY